LTDYWRIGATAMKMILRINSKQKVTRKFIDPFGVINPAPEFAIRDNFDAPRKFPLLAYAIG
jgi:hypothetical protein